jgi:hypothetical protein
LFRKLPLTREFSHPLARAARIWTAQKREGSGQRVLVIVTTMELDPGSERYNKKLVEKLSRAAQEYLALSSLASGFVIMNPMRQWRRDDRRPAAPPKRARSQVQGTGAKGPRRPRPLGDPRQ